MRRLLPVFLLLLAVPACASRHFNVNFDDHGGDITDCSQLHMTVGGHDAIVEQQVLPLQGISSLKLHASRGSGVRVRSGSGYAVVACKGAALGDQLRQIHVNVAGNEVTSDGPAGEEWGLYFLVSVPHNGNVDVTSEDGPVSVKGVTGTVTAEAENGPIAYSGGAGTVRLHAHNGPIAVKLSGEGWSSGSLDARTDNGPVALTLPRSYRSGVLVETNGGPVVCKAEGCGGDLISLQEGHRKINLGHGAQVIHLTAENGPVAIKD